MPKEVKLKKYEEVLAAALKFTDDDLAMNAAGRLSKTQVAALHRRRTIGAVMIGGLCVTVAFFLLIGTVGATASLGPILLAMLVFMAFALAVGALPAVRITRDLKMGVQVAEGRVELDTTPAQNSASYRVKVDGRKFNVQKRAFLAFKNGDPYRIYYAPNTKMILSAEWLRDDNPFIETDEEVDTDAVEERPYAGEVLKRRRSDDGT
ncbi:MAG: hypothetical protein J0M07_23545 [Anaerolineae bacterium]|jgi:hypothetical protein|uniref:hypothetical protein n=1 Tax=Candidatus Flexifilum breve TaxID=3140694 RepID=UPI001AC617FA|nr:hypothetical protein [Chloroflexota bacterium]MBK9747408.1 hypothetical protein [Chloroflexota bacterium]MBN8638306.1 hypothetical protein [Anaerolineae bacterium]